MTPSATCSCISAARWFCPLPSAYHLERCGLLSLHRDIMILCRVSFSLVREVFLTSKLHILRHTSDLLKMRVSLISLSPHFDCRGTTLADVSGHGKGCGTGDFFLIISNLVSLRSALSVQYQIPVKYPLWFLVTHLAEKIPNIFLGFIPQNSQKSALKYNAILKPP